MRPSFGVRGGINRYDEFLAPNDRSSEWNLLERFGHRLGRCPVKPAPFDLPMPPTPPSADAAFVSFQRQRTAEALGRVYELLAADLVRVARGIVGDQDLADDVVPSALIEVSRRAE